METRLGRNCRGRNRTEAMSAISGPSLLAVQAYASQVAPTRPANVEPPRARVEARPAFSVELSKEAANALRDAGAAKQPSAPPAAARTEETGFQAFVSAKDMGARPVPQEFAREAPMRSAEAPARNVRPGTHLDIKI